MFRTLCERYGRDKDFPERAWRNARLRQVLEGTIYDCLNYPFSTEYNGANEYVKVHDRRPSVQTNVCRVVVEDSVSMLFGDGRFPQLHCADEPSRLTLASLVSETQLVGTMEDAALRGSIGSIAVRMRVLDGRVFFDVMDTDFLTPEWKPTAPDTLLRVTEKYKVRGSDLLAQGYAIPAEDLSSDFWFQRVWTDADEEWYLPLRVAATKPNGTPVLPTLDAANTVHHGLGFVPLVWIKNLPGKPGIDGTCTFLPAINTQIEADYQLSQAGRGLRYSSDPLLIIKEPSGTENKFVRNAANALVVDEKGDAKLLEIGGTAAEAVISYTKHLRELALETIHGNRSTPDKAGMAQSGRALELLHEPLIWLADRLRTSYGAGLLALVRMVVAASRKMSVSVAGAPLEFPASISVTLRWGHWFHPSHHDNLEEAQALANSAKAGHISRQTAVMLVCERYDIPDAPAELAKIEADLAEADARALRLAEIGQSLKVADNLDN